MKNFIIAMAVAAGLFMAAAPSEANAQGIYIGRGGVRVMPFGGAYRYGGYYGARPYYRPYFRNGWRGPGFYPYTSGYRYGYYGRRW